MERLCTALTTYLPTMPDLHDPAAAAAAVTTFKQAVLGFEARRKKDSAAVDPDTMLIDVRNAANLFRAAPATSDLASALRLAASALNNNTRCILPPRPATECVWESMKAKNFMRSTLQQTKGWVSVSGPKMAGKSARVLSTCHALINRWVPVAGTSFDLLPPLTIHTPTHTAP